MRRLIFLSLVLNIASADLWALEQVPSVHQQSIACLAQKSHWDPVYLYYQSPDVLASMIALVVIGAVIGRRVLEYLMIIQRLELDNQVDNDKRVKVRVSYDTN